MAPPTLNDGTPVVLAHNALNSLASIRLAAATLSTSWHRLSAVERNGLLEELERRAAATTDQLVTLIWACQEYVATG